MTLVQIIEVAVLVGTLACLAYVGVDSLRRGNHRTSNDLTTRIGGGAPATGATVRPRTSRERSHPRVSRATALADTLPLVSRLGPLLEQSQLSLSPSQATCAAAGIVGVVTAITTCIAGLVAATLAAVICVTSFAAFILRRRSQDRRAFREALPDTLELLIGALSSGHALTPAVEIVARETRGPTAREWSRAVAEAQLGADLLESLASAATRMSCVELEWAVVVMTTSREIGGSLSEVLRAIIDTLRSRERQRRRTRALTAEGRLSAVILCALPLVFTGYLAAVRPDYLGPLVSTPAGNAMTITAVTLLMAGIVWMRLLVRDQESG